MKEVWGYEVYIESTAYKNRLQMVTDETVEGVQSIYDYMERLNGYKNAKAHYNVAYVVVRYIDDKTRILSTTYNVKPSLHASGVYVHGYNNLPEDIKDRRITDVYSLI